METKGAAEGGEHRVAGRRGKGEVGCQHREGRRADDAA
jgi:hypothetical protein